MQDPLEDPLGAHYIIELWDCNQQFLNDLAKIREGLRTAADLAGATIVNDCFHQFAPQGVSGVVVIAESHLSIHTWPELGYAALDLFTCKLDMDLEACFEHIRSTFGPGQMDVRQLERGVRHAPARSVPR